MNTFLERLSLRAQSVISTLSASEPFTYKQVVEVLISAQGLGAELIKSSPQVSRTSGHKKTFTLASIVQEAFFQALTLEHVYVGTEHILLALLSLSNSPFYHKIKSDLERMNSLQTVFRNIKGNQKNPALSSYATDLTRKTTGGNNDLDIVQRKEIDQVYAILLQRNNSNLIIVGDPGVGKDTLVNLLAKNISIFEAPQEFLGASVIELDFPSFISGLSSNDTIDSAVKSLSVEIASLAPRTFVSVRNFQSIFSTPGMSIGSSLAFKNLVERLNKVGAKVIIAVDSALYEKISADQEQLLRGFSVLWLREPSKEITMQILKKEAKRLSRFYFVKIPAEVVEYVYTKAKENLKDENFPRKGVILLDRACASAVSRTSKIPKDIKEKVKKHIKVSASLENELFNREYDKALELHKSLSELEKCFSLKENNVVRSEYTMTKKDVDRELEYLADSGDGLTFNKKLANEGLSTLADRIKEKVIGQDKAVDTVVKALIRSQMGLRAKKRPIGCFLFLGTTGVGKTELAKVLSLEYFGEEGLIRLDMSDFSEKHTVARLVGAPPGYVGYNEGGELTSKISENPRRVVLFDEIEKAHPDVLNILLQIMEEGELSDMRGEVYNFSDSIIILTSNLGTEGIHKKSIGYDSNKLLRNEEIETKLLKAVKDYIKPELLNRLDEVVVFNALDMAQARVILFKMLDEVSVQMKKRRLNLEVDQKVIKHLLEKGFSAEFGARALRRTVETELLDVIADYLLHHPSTKPKNLKVVKKGKSIVVSS